MENTNRSAASSQAIDHSSKNPHKRRRGNPRYSKKQPSNTSRPLAQRLDAMQTTHWRTGPSHRLNFRAKPYEPAAYIMTTPNGTTSTTIPSVSNIPGYNPEFTFQASPPLNPSNPERSLSLRGGQEAKRDENHDIFHCRRLVNYSDLERLTPPSDTAAKLPATQPSLSARPPSPQRKTPCKIDLPSTDLLSRLHPSRKRKAEEVECNSSSEEGKTVKIFRVHQHNGADSSSDSPWVARSADWAIVDNKLVCKASINDTTLLMREDETTTSYLERAKKVHSSAKEGDKYAVRKGTLMGIHPYIRRMRVYTSLAESSHMIAPGWLSETTTWADILSAVHAVLRQEDIEALRAKIGVLKRNENESIKHFFEYIKMLEEEVVQCGDEVLYAFLVQRCLGGLNDREAQLRAQIWLRIDGLIDEGGELVRNVKVDDARDAVYASSKLIGAPNEFVLLEEFRSRVDRSVPKVEGDCKGMGEEGA